MQGSELQIHSTNAFGQMSSVDTNQDYPIDYSMSNSHDLRSSPDAIRGAASFKAEKLLDARAQGERLKRSIRELAAEILSIDNSTDLEMGGTVTFKDGKSCKSMTVNFSDVHDPSSSKQPVTRSSKRKNYHPVRFGVNSKRFKSNFAGSESDTILSNFEAPDFPKDHLQTDMLIQEVPLCTNKAGPSQMKFNELESSRTTCALSQATDSHLDQMDEKIAPSSRILPQLSSPVDEVNYDRNKFIAPSGSTAESFSSLLSSSFLFSSSTLPPFPPLITAQNSEKLSDTPSVVDLNAESGKCISQIPSIAPMQHEFFDKAASYNMPAPRIQISNNSLSQSRMISTDTSRQGESKRNFINLFMSLEANQRNESPNKVPIGLLGQNLFKSESRPSTEEQIPNPTARQQSERTRRKRGRRPSQYVCNLCNKTFRKVCELNLHTKDTHDCYRCHICNAKFTQRSNLQRHEPIHSGERPYKCLRCPKDYLRADHLKRHMNRDHPGYNPDCYALVLSSASESIEFPKLSESSTRNKDSKMEMDVFTPNQGCFAERPSSNSTSHSLGPQETGKVTAVPTHNNPESQVFHPKPWEQVNYSRFFSIA